MLVLVMLYSLPDHQQNSIEFQEHTTITQMYTINCNSVGVDRIVLKQT